MSGGGLRVAGAARLGGAIAWLIVATAAAHAASSPYLVMDINRQPNPLAGSNPSHIRSAGDFAYLVVERQRGFELWRTDGTAAGTVALAPLGGYVDEVATVGSKAFVSASPGGLAFSDGNPAGTRPVFPTPWLNGLPWRLTPVGSLLLFTFDHPEYGFEPWSSDGTAEGTFALADLAAGAEDGLDRHARDPFALLGGEAYFFAYRGGSAELHAASGVISGTRLVRRFPGPHRLYSLREAGG